MRIDEEESGLGPIDAITAGEKARKEELAFLFGMVRSVMEDPADFPKYELVYHKDHKNEKVEAVQAESILKHRDYLKQLHYVVIDEEDKVKVNFDPLVITGTRLDLDLVREMVTIGHKKSIPLLSICKRHKDRYDLGLKEAKGDIDETKAYLEDKGYIYDD